MQNICRSYSTPTSVNVSIDDNNTTIFYHFVGNFPPPEWSKLASNNGKVFSKTTKQLLSLIVFRLQIYYNNSIDELQESYCFFEQSLGVCQRRVRQCLVELEQSGFIKLFNATVIKHGFKCRNIPCIKLLRDFQPYDQKSLGENEKNFSFTRKNFRVNPKEISGQPEKNFANYLYIDNNKNISNKSRSSESEELKNDEKNIGPDIGKKFQQQETQEGQLAKTDLDLEIRTSAANSFNGASLLGSIVTNVVEKVSRQAESTSSSNCSTGSTIANKGWFRRKRLADFYPLNQEDANLLQVKSSREFNLNFINRLLLKLAEQYPEHHFGHKKVVLTYMAKALANELRETSTANNNNFQFKSSNESKFKEQFLEKIENSTDTSKEAQFKRKIAGVFDTDIAYQLLSSCVFSLVAGDQYQLKLLKDISLSEYIKTKILQQVRSVYGDQVKQLQVIPQPITAKQVNNTTDQAYLLELSKQLDPGSVWYKVRKFLIKRYNSYIDSGTLSKLVVVKKDIANKTIILKATSAFYDYYVRDRHMEDLENAFKAQGFSFELLKFEY